MKPFHVYSLANRIEPDRYDDVVSGEEIRWDIDSGMGLVVFDLLPEPVRWVERVMYPGHPAIAYASRRTLEKGEWFGVRYAKTIRRTPAGEWDPNDPVEAENLRARIIIR